MVFTTIYNFISNNAIYNTVKNGFIYNLSWEDPAVDIKTYGPFKNKNISMITTGGDNVLDYLIEDPNSISTYDLNKHQNYLLELKMACISSLKREEFMDIFGKNNGILFRHKWNSIEKHLSKDASTWWKNNISIMDNFLFSGSISIIANFFWFFTRILGLRDSLKKMNQERTMEFQLKVFNDYKTSFLFMTKIADKLLYYFISFAGVPIRQYNMIETSNLITELAMYLFTKTNLAKDNYFYWGYIYGEWNDECCPRYLKEEYYDLVKSRLNRINIYTNYLGESNNNNNNHKTDIYILLDHMDWLDDKSIVNEINSLLKDANPDCKFCWRSASPIQPFGCLSKGKFLHSSQIGRISPNDYSDRVGMYDSIHVAQFYEPLMQTNDVSYNYTLLKDIKAQFTMFSHPLKNIFNKNLNTNNKDFIDSFYKDQADYYDSFRFRMLHGKKHLTDMIPFEKDKSLCIFAGGTGDILEYISDIVPKLKEVCVMDICEKLLEQNKKRAEFHKWNNVTSKQGDAHYFIEEKKYDYIIITYSLTMIPNWELALDNAIKSLKDDGYIAISDFTLDDSQFSVSKYFWKKLFSLDNIHLNIDHKKKISEKLNSIRVITDYGTFPHIPTFFKCPYYYGLYQKKSKLLKK